MNEFTITEITDWDQLCIVCGKAVDHGGGLAHFKVAGRMIALCCPLCIETFNKDPRHYLEMRKAHEMGTQLRAKKG